MRSSAIMMVSFALAEFVTDDALVDVRAIRRGPTETATLELTIPVEGVTATVRCAFTEGSWGRVGAAIISPIE